MIDLGPQIEALAEKLADIGERERSDVLLYAEAGDNWAGGSVFVQTEEAIVFEDSDDPDVLTDVMELWNATPADKKWRGMILFVSDGRFKAEFDYGEGWNEAEDEGERREPIVRRFFGDKPIHYPPLRGAEPWSDD
ncbi:hypothetical protein HJG53_09975 [Sphingomonas sp. ID1715]|uniref:hypothetical protein n=1 Tax=Sphingomonas sp. ID1715 TaxID=1656898 RepID=UPI001489C438|nr:hypothetical protein [Sphingomonas sp. ID1715]NNM77230.1 hypothetical protein [Sphingomonas sp. ID1715]